ncbi:MAG: short-chain dehydrogenase [Nocardioides sp.]|nr:short-chain dehydrogenase [Nocardioides sp.]
MSLDGRVALVTGGLSGIGRAIAAKLASNGAHVVVLDAGEVSRDDGISGEELVAALPTKSLFHQGDVADPDAVGAAVERTVSAFGSLDVLVNNAGVTVFKSIDALEVDDFDFVLRTNVRGAFVCAQVAVARMRTQSRRGVIVNVASNFAFVGATDAVAYCTSKGAVVSMTQALAVEVGKEGIRVNALCPGATATEFNRAHRARAEIDAEWQEMTPLRVLGTGAHLATPDQIADAALFLASDSSAFMTGASLVVDGGWNAR